MLAHYGAGSDGQQTLSCGRWPPARSARSRLGDLRPSANSLFWSPDSRQLVRRNDTGAARVRRHRRHARPLCDCRLSAEAGIVTADPARRRADADGIRRLSVGDPPGRGDDGRRVEGRAGQLPVFLPDGRRFLFTRSTPGGGAPPISARSMVTRRSGSSMARSGSSSRRQVAEARICSASTRPGWSRSLRSEHHERDWSRQDRGGRGGCGVRFGERRPGHERRWRPPRTIPTWFDRKGASLGEVGEAGFLESVRLSPDGRKLATGENPGMRQGDIWLQDLAVAHAHESRSTQAAIPRQCGPLTGAGLAFTSERNGVMLPYQRAADGTGR